MKLYNSLFRQLEEFEPLEQKKVIMYVCGLTPYDHTHIGHVRTYIAFDILKRYLKRKYKVYHIQNITDVEDKIINRCKETNQTPKDLTEKIHNEALELFDKMNITRADEYPKVTEHIGQIVELIKKIIKNGHAYETKTGIYFDVSSFREYGNLSGQNLQKVKAGSRFEPDETKKNPEDFALWKKTNGELIEFDSLWGRGRPGWHIECSAMSLYYGKRTLDIHGGARDLIFPHHENEIAQSEAGIKEKFTKYWLHTGFLTVNGEKMSKSLGNFITVKDALAKFTPNQLRFFFIQSHYRSPVDYDEEKIKAAGEAVERIFNSLEILNENIQLNGKKENEEFRTKTNDLIKKFYQMMEEDLNTPLALSMLFELLHLLNIEKTDTEQLKKLKKDIEEIADILGLRKEERKVDNEKLIDIANQVGITDKKNIMEKIIKIRNDARDKKDYKQADEIRQKLKKIGIVLEDKEGKTTWKME